MAQVMISTSSLNHQEWLAQRNKGIGGSDIAAICGLNHWRSPMDVYLEKTGEASEQDENEAMYWGNVLEEVVAQEFFKRTGMKVRRRNAILQHAEFPFMLANVDRLIIGHKEGLECKTTSEYKKTAWTEDAIPDAYFLQCQWYMGVTGYQAWWIAVLIGGNKFVYQKIERDEELIQQLISIGKDFWENHVMKQIPPEWDGSEASQKLLSKMYPNSKPNASIELPTDTAEFIEKLDEVKSSIKELESLKNTYENKVKSYLGENEIGFIRDKKVTWKSYVTNRFDTKRFKSDYPDLYEKYINESSSRRFSVN